MNPGINGEKFKIPLSKSFSSEPEFDVMLKDVSEDDEGYTVAFKLLDVNDIFNLIDAVGMNLSVKFNIKNNKL
jgi:hypothetical protein